MDQDEKEVRQLVETWMSASQAGNVETILSLMTDDVVFLRPGWPPMMGRSSFAEASNAQSDQPFEVSGTSEVQEVHVSGDHAYMWAKLSIVITPTNGDEPIEREGYTLSVLRKENGKWLLARDANMLTVVSEDEQ